jgi:putative aldouronate transport system permease protein
MKKIAEVKQAHSDRGVLLLIAPTMIWFAAFCYMPMFGIIMAFKRYRLIPGKGFFYSLFFGSEFTGLDNFRFLFLNPEMAGIVRNTLLYNLAFLVIGTVLPVILAICLSYIRSEGLRTASQTASLLPHFLSWTIVSYFVFAFLSSDKGLLNHVLAAFGAEGIRWYQEASYWPVILIMTNTWKTFGYAMVLYYAYITSVDPVLYESALVDGASVGHIIRYIMLPHLKSVILVLVLLNLGGILSTDFGLFFQVTRDSGSILSTTETIDIYIYKALIERSNYGFSAAASLIQNGIGCMLLLGAHWLTGKIDGEGGLLR